MYDRTSGRYVYPHPTAPDVFVSRQRLYQIRNVADGLCQQCGQRRVNASFCRRCQDKDNVRRLERRTLTRKRA